MNIYVQKISKDTSFKPRSFLRPPLSLNLIDDSSKATKRIHVHLRTTSRSMKPSQDSSNNSVSSSSKNHPKRKLLEQQHRPSIPKTSLPSSTKVHIEHENTPSKRLKTSHSSANISRLEIMSKTVGLVTRPGFVDLTRGPSNFQPHAGAKKLIIKGLRTTSRKDLEDHYERVWEKVDEALSAVFRGQDPITPLDKLCRGVEETCRHGQSKKLVDHLKERCRAYLEKELLPAVETEGEGTSIDSLRAVWKFWSLWNGKSVRDLRCLSRRAYS